MLQEESKTREEPKGSANGDEFELDVFDLLAFLVSSARQTIKWISVFTIVGLAISLLLKNEYQADTQLVLTSAQGGGTAAAMSRALSAGLGFFGGISESVNDGLYRKIVESRSLADHVIEKFHLKEVFAARTPDAARRVLASRLSARSEDGILTISYVDPDPSRAAQVANAVAERLQVLHLSMQFSRAKRRRSFLAERLKVVESELRHAEGELEREQVRLGALDPEEQVRVTIRVAGEILNRYYEEAARQRVLGISQQGRSAELMISEVRMEELQSQLKALDKGSRSASHTSTLPSSALLGLDGVPELKIRLARLARRVKLLQELHGLLTTQYETARIDEVNDEPNLSMLDTAVAPIEKSRPKRSLIVVAFSVAGGLMGLIFALLQRWGEHVVSVSPDRASQLRRQLGPLAFIFGTTQSAFGKS